MLFKKKNKFSKKQNTKKYISGELALCIAVIFCSFGVDLMIKSGFGVSSISSVPYVFSRVFKTLTFGTWNYIFQTCLVAILMLLKKRFTPGYIVSFGIGIIFGKSLDMFNVILANIPLNIYFRIFYFVISFLFIAFGITFANNCGLPITPTDIFPRDLSEILKIPYKTIKTKFDLMCLTLTVVLSLISFHKVIGIGIGTVICALTTGKAVAIINNFICKRYYFEVKYFNIKKTVKK